MSRMALDNLIRRELKVSDPNDPKQIAQALLARYKGSPRAAAITREAEGLPFLLTEPMAAPMTQAATSSQVEWQQATDDIERDLKELTTNTILKDVIPELEGWGMAIRSAIQEGVNSARFALDSRQRDKTFGIRRTLGDYARMARLVGALSGPVVEVNYRKLAQSIDEAASVLLVMMGEALANVGFSGGRYLLQVPYTELQTRRDAVIYALRNLVGSTQEAYAPNEWPRGLNAYRLLFEELEEQGQGDLRALLVENELSRLMDSLLQRAGQGGVEGLRYLGATAQLDIERLRRLTIIGERVRIKRQVIGSGTATGPGVPVTMPDFLHAPPLTAFLEALQLFIQSFDSAGGFRLLRLARPSILLYGLYGFSKPGAKDDTTDAAEERLLLLTTYRGMLANWLDYFAWVRRPKCQFILDKFLYDIDRAIDLYALGSKNWGKPEIRAAAYGYLIKEFIDDWIFADEFKDLMIAVNEVNKTGSSQFQVTAGALIATKGTWKNWWQAIKTTLGEDKLHIWKILDESCWQTLRSDWKDTSNDGDSITFSTAEIQNFWNCVQKTLAEKLCGLDLSTGQKL